jgi:hypothetical protein
MPRPEKPRRKRGNDPVVPSNGGTAEIDWSGWNRWLESHVQLALETERAAVGEVIGDVRGELEGQLKRQVESLRADFATLDSLYIALSNPGRLHRAHTRGASLLHAEAIPEERRRGIIEK